MRNTAGVEYLKALIQQMFVIVKLRTTLRTITNNIENVACCKRRGEALTKTLTWSTLALFTSLLNAVQRSFEVFLFTCLKAREVHFEFVPSMDSSSFVMGIEILFSVGASPPLSGQTMRQILSHPKNKTGQDVLH